MEYEDYKRAKQLQEETLPAFKSIPAGVRKRLACFGKVA